MNNEDTLSLEIDEELLSQMEPICKKLGLTVEEVILQFIIKISQEAELLNIIAAALESEKATRLANKVAAIDAFQRIDKDNLPKFIRGLKAGKEGIQNPIMTADSANNEIVIMPMSMLKELLAD